MTRVACLDIWASAVRDEVSRVAPPGFELVFADSRAVARLHALATGADCIDWDLMLGAARQRVATLRTLEP